ncbi:cache domain-containing protein [Geothrix campi]|uniref:cache domain-containing protein n=1 Tax=Geothrix campi TaxID=2966450 RepID=UPI002148D8ED|nr:cache domain-containing protein [Geothrix sp. SG10]
MEAPRVTPSSTFESKHFLRRLAAGTLVLNLIILVMGALSLRKSLRNHQRDALATAQNLAQVLDHYVGDTFGKADLALLAVKDEVERVSATRRGFQELDGFIRRQHGRVPGLRSLRTTDARGVVEHSSGTVPGVPLAVGDREYFTRLRDNPAVGLVTSKPLVGRVSGTWVIILARRLKGPDHQFAGIVYAVLPLEQFQKAFSALNVGPHGSVAIRDLDLGLIARHPEPESAGTAVGQALVSKEFHAFAGANQEVGIYRARTPFDGIQRTFAVRRVAGQPFYLLVGVADQDYLGGWWWEVAQEGLEVGLISGLTLAGFWLIRRTWLRQQAARVELEHLLAEVKTLGGMLPICSHCKKIRDDRGYWNQIEAYLNEHTDAEFTHGICPDCAKKVFPMRAGKLPPA